MSKPQLKPNRRMGPAGSENWHAMLDGAEDILREEGHAALTSRRIAERIGVKQRLIYYYFHTMDDLIVEMFHRLSERELNRLAQAARSPIPLREMWDVCVNTSDARLISEFMALANRIEGLRIEVTHFIKKSRATQVKAIKKAAARTAVPLPLPPQTLAVTATSLALSLRREEQLGINSGHSQTRKVIEALLNEFEPKPARDS